MVSKKLLAPLIAMLMIASISAAAPRASALPTPTLAISPNLVANAAPGTTVTFAVQAQNFPAFNSYDIQVKVGGCISSSRVSCTPITPNAITLNSSLLSPDLLLTECINGACSIGHPYGGDGPGVAHVAVASFTNAVGTGDLFSVNYTVTSSAGVMPVTIQADTVSDPSGTSVSYTRASGVYGTLPLSLTSFNISPNPVFQNQTRTLTAKYADGVAPFTCTFDFGDGSTAAAVTTSAQSCSVNHTYYLVFPVPSKGQVFAPQNYTATVSITDTIPSDHATGTLGVPVYPEPLSIKNGLKWTHHLLFPTQQAFEAAVQNPSQVNLLMRIHMVFVAPDGGIDVFNSPSFTVNSGQCLAKNGCAGQMAYNYPPKDGLGTYTFSAFIQFGVDTAGDGVLHDSEVLGTTSNFSGSFSWA